MFVSGMELNVAPRKRKMATPTGDGDVIVKVPVISGGTDWAKICRTNLETWFFESMVTGKGEPNTAPFSSRKVNVAVTDWVPGFTIATPTSREKRSLTLTNIWAFVTSGCGKIPA
jgi:hypothetical protein